ncbi:MAG: DUF1211 domain-containing protein [Acidobacteria bacterium]|nr:DUF1211 domain-containing protein [Acidobacteriota bacterium]MBU4306746.1 DUF1211 domain-containing protein [Acidobacteriota bacterium]MBU4405559.1 DUF1211 domain-containing protein [Acidobacteriota bacterium]MCG2810330.1 DUF1211 domain-containing protein [Candidatus Aminicenantes bacterium]
MGKEPKSVFKGDVSKARLEFLFDGVFAIAMTIMVLELKLPELQDRKSVHELGTALLHHGRTFFSYIISFIILSSFWISHNQIYANLKRISKTVLAIHIWLLATAAFFPFCAHLYGRYPSNPLASLIYFGGVIVFFLGMLALVIAAKRQKLFDPEIPARDVKKLRRGFLWSVAILLFAYVFIFVLPVWK